MTRPHPPLYDARFDHASCGLGFVARVDGTPSHDIVEYGLHILVNLAHRGATGSDPDTGDGAGLLLQISDGFFRRVCRQEGFELPAAGEYGVGMVFLSPDPAEQAACETELERVAAEEGQTVLGWRDVPVAPSRIGPSARSIMPVIRQVFVARRVAGRQAFERKLYVIRRRLHHAMHDRFRGAQSCYVASLSSRTIVYKGLLTGTQVALFYEDLNDPHMTSALALVHSRFSTNTLGSWQLAHPYRYVAHNGEINTLRGNVNWMRARERQFRSALFGADLDKIRPVIEPNVSDSAAFDNALELLVLGGRPLTHAVMAMVPEAWEKDSTMDRERRAFYQYHGSLMEPWDGPAAIAFSDGRIIGAALDRNGLRPARYAITRDGLAVLASEDGVLPVPVEDIISRWRLQPGQMLVVDTVRGRVLGDAEAKKEVVRRKPYRKWVERGMVRLDRMPQDSMGPELITVPSPASFEQRQATFGYTYEELTKVLTPMAAGGKEPISSMGRDTPLAVLSERPQLLFSYFHQLFAQVTNPPIDPLRESSVMSLSMSLGPELNLLDEGPDHCRRITLPHPILSSDELQRIQRLAAAPYHAVTLPILFPCGEGAPGLQRALAALCQQAQDAVEREGTILVLSDRGVDAEHAPIPSLLATAAIHHHLVRRGIRTRAGLVVETGEARDVHQIALLIGYGAVAIHPYLALETVGQLAESGVLGDVSAEQARERYVESVLHGLLKILSKMGISTLFSYCGAQIFEAVGLDTAVVDRFFPGTASRLSGIGLAEIARETLMRHAHAFFDPETAFDIGGDYHLRAQGEYHHWNTQSIVALQRAAQTGSFASYREFSRHFDEPGARFATLRGFLDFEPAPIPIEEVEPAREIVKRFSTGAMSFGSLSKEAHETLAIALNRVGGKSNTGEGGEDPERFVSDASGDSRRSAIKQVASGRFGVTVDYLVNADALQIKMAQGAKPGEGGQLPGHKVTDDIAHVRHSTPGVGLISPPPHHDIYSIEDLAQLIHDLKCVNPDAEISVKLVSEAGVGTVAAGVAKAKADHITIAGYDGGTGASPLSSIHYAGLPWELGLAEAQQVLVHNGLRGRVRLQVDGHLKTGRDVVVAGLLGADEFAFSTAPLVATGCVMMRACHLNTCPVGIATQDPELRRRFAGRPEHVINYLFFVAEEVRELMATLGFRRFDELIGRTDRLRVRPSEGHWKARRLDFRPLLARAEGVATRHCETQEHGLEESRDVELLTLARPALGERRPVRPGLDGEPLPLRNTERSVGAMLAGEIARRHGGDTLPDDLIQLGFRGTAGQSFGAWAPKGLTLVLEGETNDYAGKGLSGGKLVVTSPPNAAYDPERTVVVGNVALYGATGGEAYFRGIAGERFAVRNSGAHAVVEGVGDHGCEYMTGGVVVVLGPTGRNFAAGMSGGSAFVLDLWGRFRDSCNLDMVGLEALETAEDVSLVRRLIAQHREWTGSSVANRVLAHWHDYQPRFVKVMPHDLKRVLAQRVPEVREAAV